VRVLHLCPLWYPVADDAAGGIETFLAALLRALSDRGCEVSALASGDSSVSAELVPAVDSNLYDEMERGAAWEYEYYEQRELLMALQRAHDVDVIHSHLGAAAYVLSGIDGVGNRVLHTHHRQVSDDLRRFLDAFPDLWISTVSRHQASKLSPDGGVRCHVVPNGIDMDRFPFDPAGGRGLAYLGRIEPEKGTDLAVEAARSLRMPLTIAGPVVDDRFFESRVAPFLNEQIEYAGVLDHAEKTQLLGSAVCSLVPSRWEEPFGLVAIEAMACGTPVVGLASGALPELVEDGVTGFLSREPSELPALVERAAGLDRATVRARAAERFDIHMVADAYMRLYESRSV
jgi:glycosyltransferase involved in cell wall biosynthesis